MIFTFPHVALPTALTALLPHVQSQTSLASGYEIREGSEYVKKHPSKPGGMFMYYLNLTFLL